YERSCSFVEIISTTALLTTALPTTTLVTCEVPATASLTTELPTAALLTTDLPTTTSLTTELPVAALLTTEVPTTTSLTTESPTTALLTTEVPTTRPSETPQHSYLSPSYFVAPSCEDSTNIGINCNIPGTICDIQNQCVNNGKCININDKQDYNCSCPFDFSGKQCQFDQRLCKENTCLNKGVCKITSKSTFNCTCSSGFEGARCERRINYCLNITCYNEGVCRSVLLGYICQCLSGTSGQHCEKTEKKLFIYKAVSKSFAYIAIVAMVCVALFVLIIDILKYCFGIDQTCREVERIRRERRAKRQKPVIQRLIYVNITSVSDRHFRL
ncbi:unnamed protein product, partial [Adineta steineri]